MEYLFSGDVEAWGNDLIINNYQYKQYVDFIFGAG